MNFGFFFRKRDYPPAEGTFDIAARARVEPLGHAPTVTPSATFTVSAVARVEPVGAIPDVPAAPSGNMAGVSGSVAAVGGPQNGFTTIVGPEVSQSWTNNDAANTDTIRAQQADDAGFTVNVEEKVLPGDSELWPEWTNEKDAVTRYYRVRAENGSGPSPWSNVVSVKHIEDPPGVPQNLSTSSLTSTSIRMEWTAPVTGGSVASYRLVDDQTNEGAGSSPAGLTGLVEGSGHSVSVFAVGPDNQAGPLASYVGQAVRHATPGMSGCLQFGVNHALDIDDSASFRAQHNTSVKVYRDAALYDTLPDGDQIYVPAHQSGSWHVISAGGTASTPQNGSVAIPDSAKSATRTMPFSGDC